MDRFTKVALSIIIVLTSIGVIALIYNVRSKIAEQHTVYQTCTRTELVVFVGSNNTPRNVYDCTGVELKSIKR